MKRTIGDVIAFLEQWAPLSYQEEYDNSGLMTGNPAHAVSGILVTLDCTEEVIQEAIQSGCNMIVAHHPILFKGLRKITGKTYVERAIILAIKHDVAIYAIHTNLDHIHTGVNKRIADRLGLIRTRVLAPRTDTLTKLTTFIPEEATDRVLNALYEAGAGSIGKYSGCSFQTQGIGTFTPSAEANPTIGQANTPEKVAETRTEVVFPTHRSEAVMTALRKNHPYEEVAYYLSRLANENQEVGAGMIGELPEPEEPISFLRRLKEVMNTTCIRYTSIAKPMINVVAVCGGAGKFLLKNAIAQKADVFVSSDFKYHDFFEAENKITVADIGHFESEQFTKDLLVEVLSKKFPNFAVNFSKTVTNPISYL